MEKMFKSHGISKASSGSSDQKTKPYFWLLKKMENT